MDDRSEAQIRAAQNLLLLGASSKSKEHRYGVQSYLQRQNPAPRISFPATVDPRSYAQYRARMHNGPPAFHPAPQSLSSVQAPTVSSGCFPSSRPLYTQRSQPHGEYVAFQRQHLAAASNKSRLTLQPKDILSTSMKQNVELQRRTKILPIIRPVSPSTLIALTEPCLMDWCLKMKPGPDTSSSTTSYTNQK
ncbi:hypothetical protein CC2G_009287 [Coprinopsis cinerea AmutBmut pab1-1]|nr:hypothetical protein CC2G_009287 [Coprinopsis cinerea AmutBmut pab1-1]